VAEGAIFELVD